MPILSIAIPLELWLGGSAFQSGRANGNLQHLYVSGTVTRQVTGVFDVKIFFYIWIGDEGTNDMLYLRFAQFDDLTI